MFASSSRSDFQKIIGVIDHGFWIILTVVVANPVATEAGESDGEKAQKVRRSRPSFAGKGIIESATRDREQFARSLGQIALNGHRIDGVVPADENVDALYEYLIGGE